MPSLPDGPLAPSFRERALSRHKGGLSLRRERGRTTSGDIGFSSATVSLDRSVEGCGQHRDAFLDVSQFDRRQSGQHGRHPSLRRLPRAPEVLKSQGSEAKHDPPTLLRILGAAHHASPDQPLYQR